MTFPVRSIKPFLLILCIMLAVLFARIATTSPVLADVISVNSTDDVIADDGQCTLREAIIAANTDTVSGSLPNECTAGSGADVINLPAGTYTLTSQLPNIYTTINITGEGAATTIIQASTCEPISTPGGCEPAAYRNLNITNAGILTLDGVTFRHGVAENGGAIYNSGTLTLTNSVVTTNKSTSSGGGIYNSSNNGTLILDASSVSGNLAQTYGGGIMNYGKMTLNTSTISGNHATSNDGGGIYNVKAGETDIPTITNCLISGNTAGTLGGGIRNFYGLNITDSTISNNSSASSGGGITNSGLLTTDNTTISGNQSTGSNGGGIYNVYGTLNLTNRSAIQGNTANFNGGGIYNGNNAVLNITNSTLSDNIATNSSGGGIYNGATLNMAYSLIANNTAQNYHGGGIYNAYNGLMDITKIILSGNTAEQSGGGIANDSAETIYVTGCTLVNNQAKKNGGGIYNNGFMTLAGSTLSENQTDQHGGGIANHKILSVVNSTFSVNHAALFGGGAYNHFDLSLINCTLYGNTSNSMMGGIYNASGYLKYANTIIYNSEGTDCFSSAGAAVDPNTHNLVGANAPAPNNCGLPDLSANPGLSPLGNYGGPTQTYALLPASPAIDAGDLSLCPKFDQRGVKRPQDWGCDIGAFELEGVLHEFTLMVDVSPGASGTVTLLPEQPPYTFGEEITLTAIAEPDWVFDSWSGDSSGTENPLIIRLLGDTHITAHFIRSQTLIFLPLIIR